VNHCPRVGSRHHATCVPMEDLRLPATPFIVHLHNRGQAKLCNCIISHPTGGAARPRNGSSVVDSFIF